jgi:hypothetical protein
MENLLSLQKNHHRVCAAESQGCKSRAHPDGGFSVNRFLQAYRVDFFRHFCCITASIAAPAQAQRSLYLDFKSGRNPR